MLRRLFAVALMVFAASLFVMAFVPMVLFWFITGKDYITSYVSRCLDIFEYMIKS